LTSSDNIPSEDRLPGPRPLHDLLRELRATRGRSLRAAARALDLDPGYLSRVERGEKPASSAMLARAAAYYEVPRELLALSRGNVPDDVVAILQRHPELLDELRRRHGSE
jgi:transcriptional regulator with XRE-family HTH domain